MIDNKSVFGVDRDRMIRDDAISLFNERLVSSDLDRSAIETPL